MACFCSAHQDCARGAKDGCKMCSDAIYRDSDKPVFVLKCTRCGAGIETTTAPGPKLTGFLCISCHMKWLDIEKKLEGHVYADEKRAAFIKFVNDLVYLRNHTLGR